MQAGSSWPADPRSTRHQRPAEPGRESDLIRRAHGACPEQREGRAMGSSRNHQLSLRSLAEEMAHAEPRRARRIRRVEEDPVTGAIT